MDLTASNILYVSVVRSYSDGTNEVRETQPNQASVGDDVIFKVFRSDSSSALTATYPGYGAHVDCAADGTYCYYVALKDKPANTTTVAQMPTTGAPEGLSSVGLAAAGVGLLGVLVRRRRV